MRYASLPVLAMVAVLAAQSASAQTAATPPEQTAPPTEAAPPVTAGEDWNVISRSATRAYLVDVNSIKADGDVTRANLVRAPLSPATDKSYTLVELEYRCAAKQSRAIAEIDHDEAGAALDRSETGEEFEAYGAESLFGFIGSVVCDDARSTPSYPSVVAWFDAGRL